MKSFQELRSQSNFPQLIPTATKTERKLLSIFMGCLEGVPSYRAYFLEQAGCGIAKSGSYTSFMEPSYDPEKYKDVRPDGLIACVRGSNSWQAFIEAKAEKGKIRPEQISEYTDLASSLGVGAILTISNEFASRPDELPYFIQKSKIKKRELFHFSWSEIRNQLALFLVDNGKLNAAEKFILESALTYFWNEKSGIMTYDEMPVDWPSFVESASTKLGFSSRTQGITEIIHGWQQEKRDLCSKLGLITGQIVEVRHDAGVRADAEQRVKFDRELLAQQYQLTTNYYFPKSKTSIKILADLRSCSISTASSIALPEGKKSRATLTWLQRELAEFPIKSAKISIDWPGRGNEITKGIEEFLEEPEKMLMGQTDAPKRVVIIYDRHEVRRFKSRKRFVEDLENLTTGIASELFERKLMY